MGFSSLADEIADVFDQEVDGAVGGRSLADEFGMELDADLELDNRFKNDGECLIWTISLEMGFEVTRGSSCAGDKFKLIKLESLDEIEKVLDTSPNSENPHTPPRQRPSSDRIRLQSSSKASTPSDIHNEGPDDFLDLPNHLSRYHCPGSPSISSRRKTPEKLSPVALGKSMYMPIIEKDPLVELAECVSTTNRLIIGLKAIPHSGSILHIGINPSTSSGSVGSVSKSGKIGVSLSPSGHIIDTLTIYATTLNQVEKRMDHRIKELEELTSRWESVGFGVGATNLDLKGLINGIEDRAEQEKEKILIDGLPSSSPRIMTTLPSDSLLSSPSLRNMTVDDTFSPKQIRSIDQTLDRNSTILPIISQSISPDPLIPSLINLRELLHTHSSHDMATQRQIRQIKGAIQSAKERDMMEEEARAAIEVWEAKRVKDGLKGERVRDVLDREMKGWETALEKFEIDVWSRLGKTREINVI